MMRVPRRILETLSRTEGDPLKELERREQGTCAGCAWEARRLNVSALPEVQGIGRANVLERYCRRGRMHGARCSDYLSTE